MSVAEAEAEAEAEVDVVCREKIMRAAMRA